METLLKRGTQAEQSSLQVLPGTALYNQRKALAGPAPDIMSVLLGGINVVTDTGGGVPAAN